MILGCADKVCSTNVVPERGKPRMKIGCARSRRTPARGKIRIRNREGLKTAACDCCNALSRAYWPAERLKGSTEAGETQTSVC